MATDDGRPDGTPQGALRAARRPSSMVLSTAAAAAAALLATIIGTGGCENSAGRPGRDAASDPTAQVQALQRDNAELRRRLDALERARPAAPVAPAIAEGATDSQTDRLSLERLLAENEKLRVELETKAAATTPPPVVLPRTPSAPSTGSGRSHYSHSSHASHASHRSHSSHRSSR